MKEWPLGYLPTLFYHCGLEGEQVTRPSGLIRSQPHDLGKHTWLLHDTSLDEKIINNIP